MEENRILLLSESKAHLEDLTGRKYETIMEDGLPLRVETPREGKSRGFGYARVYPENRAECETSLRKQCAKKGGDALVNVVYTNQKSFYEPDHHVDELLGSGYVVKEVD